MTHEEAILDLEAEHKRLLIAQVTMNETLNRITIKHEEGTEKLNALIQIVDEWMRRNPRPSTS